MQPLLRTAGSVLLGLAIALSLVILVEGFGAFIHPFPEGADLGDPEVIKAHVARFPDWALAVVVVAWGISVFVSVWVATRLGTNRHPAHGIVVGLLLLSAAACNMAMLPYPARFEVANYLLLPLAVFLGVKVGRGYDRRG